MDEGRPVSYKAVRVILAPNSLGSGSGGGDVERCKPKSTLTVSLSLFFNYLIHFKARLFCLPITKDLGCPLGDFYCSLSKSFQLEIKEM